MYMYTQSSNLAYTHTILTHKQWKVGVLSFPDAYSKKNLVLAGIPT